MTDEVTFIPFIYTKGIKQAQFWAFPPVAPFTPGWPPLLQRFTVREAPDFGARRYARKLRARSFSSPIGCLRRRGGRVRVAFFDSSFTKVKVNQGQGSTANLPSKTGTRCFWAKTLRFDWSSTRNWNETREWIKIKQKKIVKRKMDDYAPAGRKRVQKRTQVALEAVTFFPKTTRDARNVMRELAVGAATNAFHEEGTRLLRRRYRK